MSKHIEVNSQPEAIDLDKALTELSCRLVKVQAERDALAAKLKELGWQEPVGRYYWESVADATVMAVPSETTPHYLKDDFPLSARPARPVPADPVNARLVAAAKAALDALTCSGEADDPGHRCGHCDDYVDRNGVVRAALRDALSAAEAQQAKPVRSPGVCQGTNCGATNGANHSPECIVETAEAQGWGNAPEAMEARRLIAQKAEPVNARLVDALKRCEAAFDIYHSCFQVTGNETGMADAAKYIMVARSALAAAKAQQAEPVRLTRESVARAIWSVRREHEDRCDLELEDMQDIHPVWREADAVLAVTELAQSKPALMTIEQARDSERYAYLRSQHEGSVAASFAVFAPEQPIGEFGPVGSMPGELDAAIDAAMRADSHKVEG